MAKRKMRVTFDAPGERWSAERDRESRARLASGWTSLRVTKQTARELRALTKKAGDLLGYSYGRLSPDELLAHLARGLVQLRQEQLELLPARKRQGRPT